jgi:hypothetical protein
VTFFAKWTPWAARFWLFALLLLTVSVVALPRHHMEPPPPPAETSIFRDNGLYEAVVARLVAGEDYYQAAAAEHRIHQYPTSPPEVFRQPWLAWMLSLLRLPVIQNFAVYIPYAALAILFYRELDNGILGTPRRVAMFVVFLTGVAMVGMSGASFLHELWAAALIGLSLMTYRSDRWILSVLLAFVACLFRELAVPFLGAMAAFALCERRWKELGAWLTAAVIFCLTFAAHLIAASALYRPGDLVSPGWISVGGLPFVILTARWNIALYYLPDALVALAVGLGITGLVGWRDPRASRAALVLGGYLAAFGFVGRPNTSYWGQLYAPLLGTGLALAPIAVADLLRRALGRSASATAEIGRSLS